VKKFIQSVAEKLQPYDFHQHIPRYLVENYGQKTTEIINRLTQRSTTEDPELSLLKAELAFCVHHEMVCSLQDFFVRRTGLVNFDIHRVVKWKDQIAVECKTYLHWNEEKMSHELNSLNFILTSVTDFK
jgi:glycerol-3-phosphate dehydrogenase